MPEQVPPAPRVGAVVLTWRDRVQTVACVEHLLASPLITRVIVVDNEADGTIADAFEPEPRIGFRELAHNTGFAVGVNTGIRDLLDDPDIDQLLIINNDATLTPADLDVLVARLVDDESLGAVGPRIVTPEGAHFSAGGMLNRFTWSLRQPREGEQPDFLTWACILARPSVFESAGLLDERFFMYWEDVEFGLRLTAHRISFTEVASARLVHAVSSSHSRAGSRILAYSSEGFRHLLRLHGGSTRVLGYARLLLKVVLTALKGDIRGAKYVLAGWRIGRDAPSPAWVAFDELA
ncbi:glycosyltransferase family 2 protein [Microbacterium aoyamense]|uniref:Glycosyltransferase family 2 protein n=1 Tax=Microbacterium aoyamense TaxID=344166 RepID=A0ABN2PP64_9MICO|nr:glycosyltransferase [Microbacterium aoyamense]